MRCQISSPELPFSTPRRRLLAALAFVVLPSLVACSANTGNASEALHSTIGDNPTLAHDGMTKPGCTQYMAYAQNRYNPVGARLRAAPTLTAKDIDAGFAPNQAVTITGWTAYGLPPYPNNTVHNTNVWFHVAKGQLSGWVTDAGLRNSATTLDLSGGYGPDTGGNVPTPPQCQVAYSPDANQPR